MMGLRFSKRNILYFFTPIFILCIWGMFLLVHHDTKVVYTSPEETIVKPVHDYPAELFGIVAKSYYVYDLKEGKMLFAKSEHDQLPLASVTKLMSGFVVMDVLPVSTIINISLSDIRAEGDSGLVVGEKWKLKSLLDFSLISSSNDGMEALARTLDAYEGTTSSSTVALMNVKAKDMGLVDTFFVNPTGLDLDARVSGAYSSAYDVSMLLGNILKNNPSVVSQTKNVSQSFISESNIKHFAQNTNIAIGNIPALIASKTGFTDLAGGNLAIAFDAGFTHPVIVVVLGSTAENRFTDVEKLVHVALEKLSE